MDIHSDSADMSDSFAMRPAKRIRALNRDLGESNGQNSGSNCFSSVMIKKEKVRQKWLKFGLVSRDIKAFDLYSRKLFCVVSKPQSNTCLGYLHLTRTDWKQAI